HGMSGGVRTADAVSAAIARAFRDERAIVLATLIRQAGDFQLAEDAVQDAFEAAVTAWRRDGGPAQPGAWVTTAAPPPALHRPPPGCGGAGGWGIAPSGWPA